MAYFPDLSPYGYGGSPSEGMVNVGWLSKDFPFQTGDVSDEFLKRLTVLAAKPENLYRGSHNCEFCGGGWGDRDRMGNGEVRVHGKDGTKYAAPALVLHYVKAHKYRPPEGFIAAVMEQGDA